MKVNLNANSTNIHLPLSYRDKRAKLPREEINQFKREKLEKAQSTSDPLAFMNKLLSNKRKQYVNLSSSLSSLTCD